VRGENGRGVKRSGCGALYRPREVGREAVGSE
jgi:hypothetical protein